MQNFHRVTEFVFHICATKDKMLLLQGFAVATVTFDVTIMTASCSAIIGVSYSTITMLIRDTAL